MDKRLALGQRVQIRPGVEKYGGLFGEIIHRQRVAAGTVYHREHLRTRADQGQLALVVQLENPSPDLEPVILCYEEHISEVSDG